MLNSNKDIKEFVSRWNQVCPVDRWWRKKHNIPFNSPIHRASSFIDMYFEFVEDNLYLPKDKDSNKEQENPYIRGKGNFMKTKIYTEEDIDKVFEDLDIESID